MNHLTLESMPGVVAQLSKDILEIKTLLLRQHHVSEKQSDQMLNTEQAAEFLNLSVQTVYGYVNRRTIPYMKRSKKLYFSTEELTQWLKSARKGGDQ
jgi:excisionase family DNA binding protein